MKRKNRNCVNVVKNMQDYLREEQQKLKSVLNPDSDDVLNPESVNPPSFDSLLVHFCLHFIRIVLKSYNFPERYNENQEEVLEGLNRMRNTISASLLQYLSCFW